MSGPGALEAKSTFDVQRAPGALVFLLAFTVTFGLSVVWFGGAFEGRWPRVAWDASGPLLASGCAVTVLARSPANRWWLAPATLYLQVARLHGDAGLPLWLTLALDGCWCLVLMSTFQRRRGLAVCGALACGILAMLATLVHP